MKSNIWSQAAVLRCGQKKFQNEAGFVHLQLPGKNVNRQNSNCNFSLCFLIHINDLDLCFQRKKNV